MSTKNQGVTPYLSMENCQEAHEWYVQHCGAEVVRVNTPQWDENDKRYLHSVIEFPNKAQVYMSDRFDFGGEHGEKKYLTKEQMKSAPFSIHLQFDTFEDGEKYWNKVVAEKSGAQVVMKFEKQFWNECFGKYLDPFGFEWSVGSPLAESSKKRCLSDAKTSDNHTSEDGSPSNKKHKVHSHGHAEKSHFLGVVDCEEKWGLFREFRVGKSVGVDFKKAITEGMKSLREVTVSNSLMPSVRGIVSVCPENPFEMAVVRCLPGMIFDKSCEELEKCKRPDSVLVRRIPAGKYLVYLHVGSYAELPAKWGQVVDEFRKKGYKLAEGESCYEEYLNTPEDVPEEQLQTKIYRGIASDL